MTGSLSVWKFIFPLIVFAGTIKASDPGDAKQNEVNGDQGFAYSFSGNFENPSEIPYAFRYFPQFNFDTLFTGHFDNLRRLNEELTANIGNQIQAASQFANPANYPNIASRFSDAADGNSGSASATGYIGNGEIRQTARVNPQNPNFPNVNARFGANTNNGGSYGVYTSSFSETLPDRNGKPVTRQKASTTVNDNGKVTSYSVHNP